MKRRDFIAGSTGAAVWALGARAQQGERTRRIGVLMDRDENDPAAKAMLFSFSKGLGELAWSDGRNLQIPSLGPREY
jgi:putative ABC transport system substrate-binding protein